MNDEVKIVAKNGLAFLNRVDLKGQEAAELFKVQQLLSSLATGQAVLVNALNEPESTGNVRELQGPQKHQPSPE